jgi:hypothetical protein
MDNANESFVATAVHDRIVTLNSKDLVGRRRIETPSSLVETYKPARFSRMTGHSRPAELLS